MGDTVGNVIFCTVLGKFHMDIISDISTPTIDDFWLMTLLVDYITICTFTKFVLFSDHSGVETGIETKRSAGSQTARLDCSERIILFFGIFGSRQRTDRRHQ